LRRPCWWGRYRGCRRACPVTSAGFLHRCGQPLPAPARLTQRAAGKRRCLPVQAGSGASARQPAWPSTAASRSIATRASRRACSDSAIAAWL